ncbi:MAG: Gfo/Idh/MocA family oxidoreductase [Planctomycetota bacterium]
MTPPSQAPNRRGFLTSVAAGAAAAAASPLTPTGGRQTAAAAGGVHTGVDETLRVGLVGCGGRGTGAVVDALVADPLAKLVAVGDAFADRTRQCLAVLKDQAGVAPRCAVDPDNVFVGFDAYRRVIDAGVDVVLLATPPHLRPEHVEYAVQQRKHVFVEKPVATDMPGAARVAKACGVAAEAGLSVVSGLCWRYDLGVRATMEKIADGAIGDVVAIESAYNTGALWHRGDNPAWSRMEHQLRNWLYYTWLSGDQIVEQAIHSLDKTAWLLGDASPVRATGLGGRQQRTEAKYGNVYDHFTVFYEYASGQNVYFTCRQQDGCSTAVDEVVQGAKGKARVLRHRITGEQKWRYRGPKPSMYRNEQAEFFASIRRGEPINNGAYMVNSTRIAIMGRMAAYTGRDQKWDEAIADTTRLGPAEYAWGDAPTPPVAIPGREA